jgi:phage major head subunit gpT-like protein
MAQDLTLSTRAQAALYGFSTRFQTGMRTSPSWWRRFATEIPSDSEREIHAWIELIPGFTKWKDERKFHSIGSADYSLLNEDYAAGIRVPRNKVEDDKLGLYAHNAEMLGMQAAKFPDRQCALLLKNGHTAAAAYKCYDGKPFFATDHPKSVNGQVSGTFSNYRTSLALTPANFNTAYAAMQAFPGPDGEVMGITATRLSVPPALRATALEIADNAALIIGNAGGTAAASNVNAGLVEVEVIPELAGADTTWYLGCHSWPIQPLIVQVRQMPGFDEIAGLQSEHCKLKKELLYGSDGRFAFGYSFPHLMIKAVA